MARLATFFYWGCWLALLLGTGRTLRAQTPDTGPGVAVPNAPGLASPPLPPRASPTPTTVAGPASRQLNRTRVLKFEIEPTERALVRRLHPRATVPDSLTALRTVRELVLALQAEAYLTASADAMRWGRDST
jgi:translocation and assembly module TamA